MGGKWPRGSQLEVHELVLYKGILVLYGINAVLCLPVLREN